MNHLSVACIQFDAAVAIRLICHVWAINCGLSTSLPLSLPLPPSPSLSFCRWNNAFRCINNALQPRLNNKICQIATEVVATAAAATIAGNASGKLHLELELDDGCGPTTTSTRLPRHIFSQWMSSRNVNHVNCQLKGWKGQTVEGRR